MTQLRPDDFWYALPGLKLRSGQPALPDRVGTIGPNPYGPGRARMAAADADAAFPYAVNDKGELEVDHSGQPVRLDKPIVETIAFPDEGETTAPAKMLSSAATMPTVNLMGDPAGMPAVPEGKLYDPGDQYALNKDEEDVLLEQFGWRRGGVGEYGAAMHHPIDAIDFKIKSREAWTFGRNNEVLGPGEQGNHNGGRDALRHSYWNARMAQRNAESARHVADGHEISTPNSAAEHFMDLHNNMVGRRIGAENPNASKMDMRRLIEEAYRRGELITDVHDAKRRLRALIEERKRQRTGGSM